MTRALHLTVSPKLFYELESVLRRPKIASRLTARAADAFIESVADVGQMVADPRRRWPLSNNPDDDYLIALAQITGAILVTGDPGIHADHPDGVVVIRPADLLEQVADTG